MSFLNIFGDPNQKRIDKMRMTVEEINALEDGVVKLSDAKIRERIKAVRSEITDKVANIPLKADDDKTTKKTLQNDVLKVYLPEVFALTREAAKRALGQRHFDVQLIGGMTLNEGNISEMMTGEGKTLVATLPAALNALTSLGVHVITVNDYLARRDAGWMGNVYDFLGLTVGVIVHDQAFLFDKNFEDENALDDKTKHLRPVSRREAYLADITYGTNNEYGFDYLRDNMVQHVSQMAQRDLNFAIVDEVDSILIDEARTPLIISGPAGESTSKYQEIDRLVKQLKPEDSAIDEKMNAATLTDAGIAHMEKLLGVENIYEDFGFENVHHIEQALKANLLFKKDKDYVIKDGEIIIVDEFTGRLMHGRRYSEGLHQAIEAKENVEVKKESLTLATISFQNYFRLYTKLSGMTGTALTEAEEFAKIYSLEVISIPSNRQNVRIDLSDMIYKSEHGKFLAIAEEIKERSNKGQPVLVGTVSIEKNELLSDLLKRNGVKHEVLNAKNHEKEAAIISKAGEKGAVTVATNMAGRGTDIVLDKEAQKLGGLHVIGTERHESRRIDNQLRGRAGRQGDPGSTQFFVSLEDDLMRIFGSDRVKGMMDKLGLEEDQPIQHSMISKSLESAQRRVEGYNFDMRKHLVEYDDVMNKQRAYIYNLRRQVLENDSLKDTVLETLDNEINHLVTNHTDAQTNEVMADELVASFENLIGAKTDITGEIKRKPAAKVVEVLENIVRQAYEDKEKRISSEVMRLLEKSVYLHTIDMLWIDHLDAMTHLREGIGLRGYGQKEPLIEYKNESYQMFRTLLAAIDADVSGLIFKAELTANIPQETELTRSAAKATPQEEATQTRKTKAIHNDKIGRNDPCPCGSGKKYKKCCGK